MSTNEIRPDFSIFPRAHTPPRTQPNVPAPLSARLAAKLFAGRLDRDLDAGAEVGAGSALAVHAARLTSIREREELARALRNATKAAAVLPVRAPLKRDRIAAEHQLIDDITLRLHAPRPVRARGMARLRILLSDGTGPLYRSNQGSLAAALRGVLAAL